MAGFKDIIGQEQIKEHLQNALTTKKVSHAYIINGEKSSGKEYIAKVFAMALQCERGELEPCPTTPAAPAQGSTSSSGEYDDVPKTGESSAVVWLFAISAACFAGSVALRKRANY